MYANLRTVDGETNHYLVPRTLPLTDAQADLVEILDTDDPGLQYYRDHDYLLTWQQLRVVPVRPPGRPASGIAAGTPWSPLAARVGRPGARRAAPAVAGEAPAVPGGRRAVAGALPAHLRARTVISVPSHGGARRACATRSPI